MERRLSVTWLMAVGRAPVAVDGQSAGHILGRLKRSFLWENLDCMKFFPWTASLSLRSATNILIGTLSIGN
jgi:hypothetical protein